MKKAPEKYNCLGCKKEVLASEIIEKPCWIFLDSSDYKFGLDPIASLFKQEGFHPVCFKNWPEQENYCRWFFDKEVEKCKKSSLNGKTFISEKFAIFINVFEPYFLDIYHYKMAYPLLLSLRDWQPFDPTLKDKFLTKSYQIGEKQFIEEMLLIFASEFPNPLSIFQKTCWDNTEFELYDHSSLLKWFENQEF